MIRRMEARISSIGGSCDLAGCVMRASSPVRCRPPDIYRRSALPFGQRGGGESSAISMKRHERLCHAKNRRQTTTCALCATTCRVARQPYQTLITLERLHANVTEPVVLP